MKRMLLCLAASLFATSIASADPLPHVTPISPLPPNVPVLRGPLPVLTCPNPAAARIDFTLAARTSRFAGRARIVGTLKNVGGAPYVSGPNQQIAVLYELPQGGRPRVVAQRAFQNLAPDAEISVAFERTWNASSPAEGEFPPTYRLLVSYDPDILLDGNVKNDDCDSGNNVRDRSGTEINALFR